MFVKKKWQLNSATNILRIPIVLNTKLFRHWTQYNSFYITLIGLHKSWIVPGKWKCDYPPKIVKIKKPIKLIF